MKRITMGLVVMMLMACTAFTAEGTSSMGKKQCRKMMHKKNMRQRMRGRSTRNPLRRLLANKDELELDASQIARIKTAAKKRRVEKKENRQQIAMTRRLLFSLAMNDDAAPEQIRMAAQQLASTMADEAIAMRNTRKEVKQILTFAQQAKMKDNMKKCKNKVAKSCAKGQEKQGKRGHGKCKKDNGKQCKGEMACKKTQKKDAKSGMKCANCKKGAPCKNCKTKMKAVKKDSTTVKEAAAKDTPAKAKDEPKKDVEKDVEKDAKKDAKACPMKGRGKGHCKMSGKDKGQCKMSGKGKGQCKMSGKGKGQCKMSGKGKGKGHGKRHGMSSKFNPIRILIAHKSIFELRENQVARLEMIADVSETKTKHLMRAIAKRKMQLRKVAADPKASNAQIRQAAKRLGDAMTNMALSIQSTKKQVKNVLTDDQMQLVEKFKTEMKEKMKKRMKSHREKMRRKMQQKREQGGARKHHKKSADKK